MYCTCTSSVPYVYSIIDRDRNELSATVRGVVRTSTCNLDFSYGVVRIHVPTYACTVHHTFA